MPIRHVFSGRIATLWRCHRLNPIQSCIQFNLNNFSTLEANRSEMDKTLLINYAQWQLLDSYKSEFCVAQLNPRSKAGQISVTPKKRSRPFLLVLEESPALKRWTTVVFLSHGGIAFSRASKKKPSSCVDWNSSLCCSQRGGLLWKSHCLLRCVQKPEASHADKHICGSTGC